jgi:hypothetical protein
MIRDHYGYGRGAAKGWLKRGRIDSTLHVWDPRLGPQRRPPAPDRRGRRRAARRGRHPVRHPQPAVGLQARRGADVVRIDPQLATLNGQQADRRRTHDGGRSSSRRPPTTRRVTRPRVDLRALPEVLEVRLASRRRSVAMIPTRRTRSPTSHRPQPRHRHRWPRPRVRARAPDKSRPRRSTLLAAFRASAARSADSTLKPLIAPARRYWRRIHPCRARGQRERSRPASTDVAATRRRHDALQPSRGVPRDRHACKLLSRKGLV